MFTPPLRELTPDTSLGFAVNQFAELLGMTLAPWQEWLNIHALELNEDGSFRFQVFIILVARQNGKSTWAKVLSLFFLLVLKMPLVIGTAQDLDVSEELWEDCVDIVQETPDLAPLVRRVIRTNGKKTLEVIPDLDKPHGVGRYKVKAATRRAGRGLTGDLVLLDELREHTTWDCWSAVTKTTMTRDNALIVGLSNAGDLSSVVLAYLRKKAHAALGDPDGICETSDADAALEAAKAAKEARRDTGEQDQADEIDWDELMDLDEDTLGLFEWSTPPGRSRFDRDGWTYANPSMNRPTAEHPKGLITERKIAGFAKTDPEWEFRTEVLCQWMERGRVSPFPDDSWSQGTDPNSATNDAKYYVGVDLSSDRTWASIAIAGWRPDGRAHVEVVARAVGTSWVKPWLMERKANIRAVAGQGRGAPVSGLMQDLGVAGFPLVPWEGTNLPIGVGLLFDGVRLGKVTHRPQPDLDIAAENAATKKSGDSGILWDREASDVDIAPLVAVNAAYWLLVRPEQAPNNWSSYEMYDLTVV